jgi:hypothetical protein
VNVLVPKLVAALTQMLAANLDTVRKRGAGSTVMAGHANKKV